MKHSKKIIALVTVFVLILSLSTMASAASGPYTYSISDTVDSPISEDVTAVHLNHYVNIATNLQYSYGSRTHRFDQSQFNSTHLSGIMQAYLDAGYKSTLTIPAASGIKRVPAAACEGEYGVLLYTWFGRGTWKVMIENTVSLGGTFRSAPLTYNTDYYCFGDVNNS